MKREENERLLWKLLIPEIWTGSQIWTGRYDNRNTTVYRHGKQIKKGKRNKTKSALRHDS